MAPDDESTESSAMMAPDDESTESSAIIAPNNDESTEFSSDLSAVAWAEPAIMAPSDGESTESSAEHSAVAWAEPAKQATHRSGTLTNKQRAARANAHYIIHHGNAEAAAKFLNQSVSDHISPEMRYELRQMTATKCMGLATTHSTQQKAPTIPPANQAPTIHGHHQSHITTTSPYNPHIPITITLSPIRTHKQTHNHQHHKHTIIHGHGHPTPHTTHTYSPTQPLTLSPIPHTHPNTYTYSHYTYI
jgi:hypothetical protein